MVRWRRGFEHRKLLMCSVQMAEGSKRTCCSLTIKSNEAARDIDNNPPSSLFGDKINEIKINRSDFKIIGGQFELHV